MTTAATKAAELRALADAIEATRYEGTIAIVLDDGGPRPWPEEPIEPAILAAVLEDFIGRDEPPSLLELRKAIEAVEWNAPEEPTKP